MNKEKIKEMHKEHKGITLIALVITIIVLLILAGVAIATLTGDNGIIQNAKFAKTSTEAKAVEEEVELIIIEAKTDLIAEGKKLTIQAISEQIKKKKDEQIEMIIRYMPTAQVEIKTEEVIGESGIIGQIHHAEIEYKGYRFILDGDLELRKEETKKIDTIKKSKIIYNLKGGVGNFTEQELETGRRLPKEEPTKQGYAFTGWSTKEDGSGKTYKAGDVYEEETDTTLYAMWGATEYELIYNANGGQVTPDRKPIIYDGEYGSLPTPIRDGYTFKGWYTESTGGTQITETMKYTIVGNQTIYARWEQDWVLATTPITATNYGDSVNYTANGITDWKVFLNDGGRIYIIAGDYAPNSGLSKATGIINGVGSYSVYTSKTSTVLLNWLKNTSYWTEYAKGLSGATATGGPTLEQFVKSYNQKMGKNYSYDVGQSDSFISGITNTLYSQHPHSSCNGYWLLSAASGSDNLWMIDCTGSMVGIRSFACNNHGVRPLVCLPSEIYANKGNNGKWSFK